MEYNFKAIEKYWQQYWQEKQIFEADNNSEKPKFYVLDMFPYPSGAGLHVGHPLGYIASDIYARFKRSKGYNVLHPMGYDSFGLPAEQYAIQTGQHPAITTKVNIEGGEDKQGNRIVGYENQLRKLGLSFDWSREIRTSDPSYYQWTQWIFIQLFNAYYCKKDQRAYAIDRLENIFQTEGNGYVQAACDEEVPTFDALTWNNLTDKGKQAILLRYRLTYLADVEVNWCPNLGTVLANDEVINGLSERGGYPVIRREMKQWVMRISAYADRLLEGLDELDWPEAIKDIQRNWIGKSTGVQLCFEVEGYSSIKVFTTRPDTIFGVTFITLAPEHNLVLPLTKPESKDAVEAYLAQSIKRSERERMSDTKTISGVFTGSFAIHPLTGSKIPIWISDYVLANYGTGAVMAVPAGDDRDYAFAKHFKLPIINIFEHTDISESAFTDKKQAVKLINSDMLDGMVIAQAIEKAIEVLEERKVGTKKVNYKLRDAVFSRQRYWGEPFPVYYKEGMPYMIEAACLPIVLPEINEYLPTPEGDPPLGRADCWAWNIEKKEIVSKKLINNQTIFQLEWNTMPGWAGSSYYFNRFMDPTNSKAIADPVVLKYWNDVDLYVGGSEHATGHLLYSRFWQKFLFDRGLVFSEEYAKKLVNQGMILGNSALIYRDLKTKVFVSKGQLAEREVQAIHVDIALISEATNQLDMQAFCKWRQEYEQATFITEDDGTYIVGREVEKMSKSKYNVLNPDDICDTYGADTLRMYEMFLGPIDQAKPWNAQGLGGVHAFLRKFWKLYHNDETYNVSEEKPTAEEMKILHQVIKKIEEDIWSFSFNTSVSALMIATNELTRNNCNKRAILEPLTIVLAPFAPHIAEELWRKFGHEQSVTYASFPTFDAQWLVEKQKCYPVSFNGKKRFELMLDTNLSVDEIKQKVLEDLRTIKQLEGKNPKKLIIIPEKIINIVS